MSLFSKLKEHLAKRSDFYDLSRNAEFAEFDAIGFRKSTATIDFVAFIKADKLIESQIIELRDKFYDVTRKIPSGFNLNATGITPNGLLVFVYEGGCSEQLASFISRQSKTTASQQRGVVVSWVMDVKNKKIHTHRWLISIFPATFNPFNNYYPGADYLQEFVNSYTPNISAPSVVNTTVKMNFREQQNVFLKTLYKLSGDSAYKSVETDEIQKQLAFTDDQIAAIIIRLKEKELAKFTFSSSYITAKGIEELEKTMKFDYQEKEYEILEKLVEKGAYKAINDQELADSLSISKNDLYVFLDDFCRKDWVSTIPGGDVRVHPAGVTAFHKWQTSNNPSNLQVSGSYFQTNIHGNSNNQIGGQNNTQNVQVNNNPDFNSAIESLIQLTETSSIPLLQREDIISDIERIKQLGEREQTPEIVEHAKAKLLTLENALKLTEIAAKAVPLITVLAAAFGG